jgi:prephenate dehydrogenase
MPRFHRVVIVGVGLLGGSIGLALRGRGLAERIIGVGRSMQSLLQAQQLGAITDVSTDLLQAATGADLVIIGTPVQTIADFVKNCCDSKLNENCLITDVGSTKANICRQLTDREHQHFCGSHPMAGSDKTGVAHARADLFVGRKTIITPVEQTSAIAVQQAESLWQQLGSEVVQLTPEVHDQAVANISHLPHVVAAALAANTNERLLSLTGDGWRDTTRVAGGEVELWRQIICENRQSLLSELRQYAHSLDGWIDALDANDQQRIVELLALGKKVRDSLAGSHRSPN